jgi:hypothetical protein
VTPQEQQLLTNLTQKINQTELQEKDPDAENLLGHELGANPDALYILAQTVLVQNIALEQAKGQLAQLQQQMQQLQQSRPQQPAHATSFLGRLLGDRDPQPVPPPPQAPPYQPVPQYAQPAPPPYAPPPQYQQPQYVQQPQYAPTQSGAPSFLRGAAQTAAGVAAGALAFEGVESILHGFGHGGGYGMGMGGMGMGSGMGMGGGFERPVEETVVNNYYDEPGRGGERQFEPGGGEHRFHETGDQGGAQFSDASYNTAGDETSREDRMAYDDSSSSDRSDDGAGFDGGSQDDGGAGFDDGGGSDNSGGDLL